MTNPANSTNSENESEAFKFNPNELEGDKLILHLQNRFKSFWSRITARPEGENNTTDGEFYEGLVDEYLTGLKERAYLERTISNQYRGRYLLELLQNAVDAMQKSVLLEIGSSSPDTDSGDNFRCHFELTSRALFVANDGQPFGSEDVRGLTAMGQSTKSAGQYIGYKGLGFRSVLEITDSPEIYSGNFSFGFNREETRAMLVSSRTNSSSQTEIDLPVISVPHVRDPRDQSLPTEEKAVLERLKEEGYATIIRLPLKHASPLEPENNLFGKVRNDCLELANIHTLLFLPFLTELSINVPSEKNKGLNTNISIVRDEKSLAVKPASLANEVTVKRLTFRRSELTIENPPEAVNRLADPEDSYQNFSGISGTSGHLSAKRPTNREDWLLIEPILPISLPSAELVASLEDPAWRALKSIKLALAFPLSRMPWGGEDIFLRRQPLPLPFFVHFPTLEGSGAGFAVHADFYLSASRKQIEWSVEYNRWVAEKLVDFACNQALDVLHFLFPDEAGLVEILVDFSYYNDSFGRSFRKLLDNRLASTSFVPVGNGNYMVPSQVVWTPLEQEGVLIFRRVFRNPGPDFNYPVLQLEQIHTNSNPNPSQNQLKTENNPYDYSSDQYINDRLTNRGEAPISSSLRNDFDFIDNFESKFERPSGSDIISENYKNSGNPKPYDAEYLFTGFNSKYEDGFYESGPSPSSQVVTQDFDYSRIRRFLSSLGVKKVPPTQLPLIFEQTLDDWETGLVLTGEICAALALWYSELDRQNQEEEGIRHKFIEILKELPVLPTISGWQAPGNLHFNFVDTSQSLNLHRFFLDEKDANILDNSGSNDQDKTTNLSIIPEAYELTAYKKEIKILFEALGVRFPR